ncbi:MAG: hypothetical protein QXJ12_01335 [Candidatus Parvarchaeota archaeon]|nr:hypothetical protein [Candidatus Parvarchaeota archaeon]
MINKIRFILIIALLAAVLILLIFMLKFASSGTPAYSLNQSQILLLDQNCVSCSNTIPYDFSYILSEFGYSPHVYNGSLGTAKGDSIISSDIVTTLPSIVIPSSIFSSKSNLLNLVSSLIYSNILTFNQNNDNLVLNTPFASSMFGPVTFYDILQNATYTALPINITDVYGVRNQTTFKSELINPIDPIMIEGLSAANSTRIVYIAGDSPFNSLESIILTDALDNFGNFSGNATGYSNSFGITSNETLGPQIGYLLSENRYTSRFFSFYLYNISSVQSSYARDLILQFDQNAVSSGSPYENFVPLIDIGGKYIMVSSQMKPTVFDGMSLQQMKAEISSNESVGSVFNDSVYLIDSMLCSLSGNSAAVCSSPVVKGYESSVLS